MAKDENVELQNAINDYFEAFRKSLIKKGLSEDQIEIVKKMFLVGVSKGMHLQKVAFDRGGIITFDLGL